MSAGQFARRKNWVGGEMTPAAADEDIRNLRLVLGNLDNGTTSWTNLSLSGQLLLPSGSVSAPSVAFSSSTNTGMYLFATGVIGFVALGAAGPLIDGSGNLQIQNGSAATPGLRFVNETNTGLYLRAAGALDFSVQGNQVSEIDNNGNFSLSKTGGKFFYPGGNQTLQILQIIQGTTSTQKTVGSATFTNTNLSATITPKYTTSNIIVWASGVLSIGAGANAFATVARGSTNLFGSGGATAIPSSNNTNVSIVVYDNPTTTAATTYNLQIRSDNAAVNTFFPLTVSGTTSTAQMLLVEIAL